MPEIARDFKPLKSRHFFWLEMVGRLKPGMTIAQAQAELDVIARRRAAPQSKNDREPFAAVVPAASLVTQTQASSRYQQMSWVLMGVVGLVLLIACGDAAEPAPRARRAATARDRDPVAVGASRGRIVRQLLVESLCSRRPQASPACSSRRGAARACSRCFPRTFRWCRAWAGR